MGVSRDLVLHTTFQWSHHTMTIQIGGLGDSFPQKNKKSGYSKYMSILNQMKTADKPINWCTQFASPWKFNDLIYTCANFPSTESSPSHLNTKKLLFNTTVVKKSSSGKQASQKIILKPQMNSAFGKKADTLKQSNRFSSWVWQSTNRSSSTEDTTMSKLGASVSGECEPRPRSVLE